MTIDERVAQLVASAPPLTEEERTRLRQLLVLVPCRPGEPTRFGSNPELPGEQAGTCATPSTAALRS